MASFPPPPPPPPPSGTYGPPPLPPPPSGNRRPALLIAGAVAVAALLGGGAYFVIRDDDETAAPTVDTSDSTVAPDDTEAPTPSTTVPVTSVPTPATAAPTLPTVAPETTIVDQAAGVLDVDLGVSMPVPPGWEITDADVATISDGTSSLTLQALARTPGEDPAVLMQEYVNTFDTDYEAISYDPSVRYERIEGALPIDQYGVAYSLFDPKSEDGVGVFGAVYAYVRADGLSVLYDIFSTEVTPGPGDASFNAFIDSLVAAPPLAAAVPLTERDTFRVTSVHEFVPVFGLSGYTLAPSFSVATQADGDVVASTGDEDFEVHRLEAMGSLDAAVAAAQAHNSSVYSNATYDPVELVDPNYQGFTRADVRWVTNAGNELTGIFSVYFDPTTGNAYAIFRAWLGFQPAPHQAEASFMFQSFAFSYTSI